VPRPVEVGIPKEEVTARVWVGGPIHTFDSEPGTPPVCVGVRVWRCSILCIRFDVCWVGEGLTAVTSSPGTIVDGGIQPTRGSGSGKPSSELGTSYGKPAKAIPNFSFCISSSTACSMVPP
jgi:hypothetical protein